MLIAWMGYALVFSALVAGAAAAAERAAAMFGAARRFVWCAALVLVATGPAIAGSRAARMTLGTGATTSVRASVRTSAIANVPASAAGRGSPALRTARVIRGLLDDDRATTEAEWRGPGNTAPERAVRSVVIPALERMISYSIVESLTTLTREESINRMAAIAWLVLTLALGVRLVAAMVTLRTRCRTWSEADVVGRRVLIADDAGPAVVGAWAPAIVVPRWALALGTKQRELILRHEVEHVHAHDPMLLRVATLLVVALPWNIVLIVQRLRLAVEIDCDARVIRHKPWTREYASLLITIGARRSRNLPFAAALAARRSPLDARIVAMTARPPQRPFVRSAPLVACAAIALLMAALTPARAFSLTSLREVTLTFGDTTQPIAPRASTSERPPTRVNANMAGPETSERKPEGMPFENRMPGAGKLTLPTGAAIPAAVLTLSSSTLETSIIEPAAFTTAADTDPPARQPAPLSAAGSDQTVMQRAAHHMPMVPHGIFRLPAGSPGMPPPPTSARARASMIVSPDSLIAWVVRYHPEVSRGDGPSSQIYIVADSSGAFIGSTVAKPREYVGAERDTLMLAMSSTREMTVIRDGDVVDARAFLASLGRDDSYIASLELFAVGAGRLGPNQVHIVAMTIRRNP